MNTNAPLTRPEQAELDKLKKQITWAAKSWVSAAEALLSIRDKRLYRKEGKTFTEFCQKNWGWTSRRVNQLIESASVVQQLPEKTRTMVPTERAARALGQHSQESRSAVVESVARNGPVTARAIAAKPTVDAEVVRWDRLKPNTRKMPPEIYEDWDRAEAESERLRSLAHTVKLAVERGTEGDNKDFIFAELGLAARNNAGGIWHSLGNMIPYTVCPFCQGVQRQTCQACKGRGFVSEDYFEGPRVQKTTRAAVHLLAKQQHET